MDSFFFLLPFFVSYPRSSLNETQPYPATWSEVSAIWKCMSEMWGIPSHYKSGAPKPPFSTISQLATLRAYRPIFGMKHDVGYTSGQVRCKLQGSPTSSRNNMNFCGPQTASNWTWVFTHPPWLLHSTSLPGFTDGDSKRNSTKLCQTVDGKSR